MCLKNFPTVIFFCFWSFGQQNYLILGVNVAKYDVFGHSKLVYVIHWQQADCHSFATRTLRATVSDAIQTFLVSYDVLTLHC